VKTKLLISAADITTVSSSAQGAGRTGSRDSGSRSSSTYEPAGSSRPSTRSSTRRSPSGTASSTVMGTSGACDSLKRKLDGVRSATGSASSIRT